MKYDIKTWEDSDLDEIVEDIFDTIGRDCKYDFKEYILIEICQELNSGNYELSEEEAKEVIKACEEKYNFLRTSYRNKEINQLANRSKIINWIKSCHNDYLSPGEVGYLLTPEEILDLIIKNYKI